MLALDNPGNGESEGDSNGLGDNAQPGLKAGLDYLARRPDVEPDRIAGFGLSLGAEVVLEAAAHDRRLAAVVCSAARPVDGNEAVHAEPSQRAITWLQMRMVRGISGMRSRRVLRRRGGAAAGVTRRLPRSPIYLVKFSFASSLSRRACSAGP